METFGAIQYITSGLSLLGLLVLVAFYLSRRALDRDQRLLEHADTPEKARLASRALEKFEIDTTGLSQSRRVELALSQLAARTERLRTVLRYGIAVVAMMVVAAVLSIVLVAKSSATDAAPRRGEPDGPAVTPTTATPAPAIDVTDSPGTSVIVGDDNDVDRGGVK